MTLKSCENVVMPNKSDNGVGFDTAFTRRGLGSKYRVKRAGLFDGKFVIQFRPGAGCVVIVTLP